MYNKIFTKILDSSIWLETDSTRIVWLTLIASMDEQGFTQFASIANLAHRARVSARAAGVAVKTLESPDKDSSDPEHEGRRIERVPGGWMVLNSAKYRDLVTRAVAQQKTRERVARFRAKKHPVTPSNGSVTLANGSVTPSEAIAEADTETQQKAAPWLVSPWADWLAYRKERHLKPYAPRGEKAQLTRLESLGEHRATAAIRYSMAQNWQGIFEENTNGKRHNTRPDNTERSPADSAAQARLNAF